MAEPDTHRVAMALRSAWARLLGEYQNGKRILRDERDLESELTSLCREVIGDPSLVGNQETHLNKRVDLRLGPRVSPVLVQLKLYRDLADWKESPSMRNTVESDLNFAEGRRNVFVGIIDTIPTTSRAPIPFRLQWDRIVLYTTVYEKHYSNINPRTSPRREKAQLAVLVRGSELSSSKL